MMRRWLYRWSAKLPCRLIGCEGRPYLERYFVLRFLGFSIYLHRFVDSDGDLETHDHPWHALAIVLAGGYSEERVCDMNLRSGVGIYKRHIRWLNWISANTFHRIAHIQPETWTLFIHGPRVKTWGFLMTHAPGAMGQNWAITYHQPYKLLTADSKWWREVPKGRSARRCPLWWQIIRRPLP